jgi:hypothetical protein
MAHFAEIDERGIVLQVIVVADANVKNARGKEGERVGADFCSSTFGGNWVQTSYNGNFRGCFAGIGYSYDPIADVFVPPPATSDVVSGDVEVTMPPAKTNTRS